jgi:MFS family permease
MLESIPCLPLKLKPRLTLLQGILNTFGVFQTYYESGDLFQETSSNISWIGSVQCVVHPPSNIVEIKFNEYQPHRSVCVLLVGACTGPIFDRGYLRLLLLIGSFGVVFGFMMLSLCTEFWQAMLAQGFCIGLGGGMLFVPSVAILPTYFSTRIGLAIGLAAAGSSMGGASKSIASQQTSLSNLLKQA